MKFLRSSFMSSKIMVIGKPGAGKGSLIKKIQEYFSQSDQEFIHLSTGDILRKEQELDTPESRELKEALNRGEFASDDLIIRIVNKEMEKNKDKNILFDGFPRNLLQAVYCGVYGIDFDKIIEVDIPDEEVIKRLEGRLVHKESGRVYNELFNPPAVKGLDDVTGEPLIRRGDDEKQVVEKRLKTYRDVTLPVLSFYENILKTSPVVKVDNYNFDKSSEVVINEIKEVLDKVVKNNEKPKARKPSK